MAMEHLSIQDVANLRLASSSFTQLPQSYFHHLVRSEMPWVWEIESLPPNQVDWYSLWCELTKADGGSCANEREREYVKKCKEQIYKAARKDLRERGATYIQPYHKDFQDALERANERAEVKLDSTYNFRGQAWPKKTEVRGLRNRRRIYGHVEEILRRVSMLPTDRGE